jgi:hypothetical protein
VLGVLMLLVYGWFIVAFIMRSKQGIWSSHCENRILFFGGCS